MTTDKASFWGEEIAHLEANSGQYDHWMDDLRPLMDSPQGDLLDGANLTLIGHRLGKSIIRWLRSIGEIFIFEK